MQSAEEKKQYYKVIIRTCYIANTAYLITHIFYLLLFLIIKIYPLVFVNIASILIYSLCYLVLRMKKYYPYALICGNEILIYMSIATILLGISVGFYLCIIGVSVVSFFSSYFEKGKAKSKIFKSIIWCSLSLIICVFLFIYSAYNAPKYIIPDWTRILLFLFHLVAVFAFIIAYLTTFLNYAMKLEDRIITESRTDKLTQVHNRYDLYNYVNLLENKSDYSLAMFDIDDFKKINDKYGHLCGDEILKELALIAKNTFIDDFVSRYGGEEFIIILKMNGDIKNSITKLENFRKTIEEYKFLFNEQIIHLTITIGLEKYLDNIAIEEWIGLADKKLYTGKTTGKNKIVY